MPNAGWTLDLARGWVAPTRDPWRRRGLAAASVAAFALSVLGDTDTRCTADDPSICGPDLTFSLTVVLAVATVALLWWRPVVAAACAVGFAVMDLTYDDVWTANVAWPVVAALHVLHVVALQRDGARQRAIAARALVPVPVAHPPATSARSAARPIGPAHLAALVLAVVALATLGVLLREQASNQAHLARSRVVHATVDEVSDDDTVTVRLDRGPSAAPGLVELEPLDPYEVGDDVLVRVDPVDPGWTHLAAEPPDPTWWASVSAGAALLSLLLVERLLTARMRRGAFLAHPPTRGVPVRCVVDEADVALVSCTDAGVVFADLDVVPHGRHAGDDERAEELAPAHLVGDVRHGGWCAVVTARGVELPEGPLRALWELPRVEDIAADDGRDPREWADPVPVDAVPARLPVRLAPSVLERGLWAGVALLAVAFAGWLLDPVDGDWLGGLFVVLFGVESAHWALSRATRSVTVDHAGLTLGSALRRVRIPISQVREVRCTGTHVVVTRSDEDVVEIGPFAGAGGRHRPDPRPAPPAVGPTAPEVAAAIDDARVAAGSVDAAVHDGPARDWGRVGAGLPWLALAVVVLGARYLSLYVV